MRAASIHGMAGMAAYMASTYKAYLGEGLGPLEWITRYKIPHPGRVAGQVCARPPAAPVCRRWSGQVGVKFIQCCGNRLGGIGATHSSVLPSSSQPLLPCLPACPPAFPGPLQVMMKATMPGTLEGILGGYRKSLEQSGRKPLCHLADKPQVGVLRVNALEGDAASEGGNAWGNCMWLPVAGLA